MCLCVCVCVCISVCVCGLLCSLFHPELCRKREDVSFLEVLEDGDALIALGGLFH